jgi:tetratricopeptide (TPR) repeat protein
MSTDLQRTCLSCGNEFSGEMQFCPICMLRKCLTGEVKSGESSFEEAVRPTPDQGLKRFEHYEVVTGEDGKPVELGHGAMGVTYKAFDTNLRCPVTLKVISKRYLGDESVRLRFLREARAAARLRHSNVASVLHLGRSGENYFYAMEFVEGEAVEKLIKRSGRLEVKVALEIALQVAAGLAALHKQKLVHRDIKPSNIMASLEEGGAVTAKIIDLGLAKPAPEAPLESAISIPGAFAGTPQFASPEQFTGVDVDIRSDLYSLGVVLWTMVTGHPVFSGSHARLMYQHQHEPLPLDLLKGVPQPAVILLEKVLEKDPARRFENPTELLKAIPMVTDAIETGRTLTRQSLQMTPRTSRVGTRKLPTRLAPKRISMEPLFLAVICACEAGLFREALHKVYIPRIQRGDTYFAANVLGGQWRYSLVTDKLSATMQIARRIYALAQERNDPRLLMGAYRALANTLYFSGKFELARQYAMRGLQIWRSGIVESPPEEVTASGVVFLYIEALTEWHLGETTSCQATIAEAISLAEELSDMHGLALCLYFAGSLSHFQCNPAEVERMASALIELSARQNFAYWRAAGETLRGWALSASANAGEGIPWIEQGIRDYRATGSVMPLQYMLALRAEALHLADRTSEALEAIREAEALAERLEECWWSAELHRLRAVFLAAIGTDNAEIEASFSQAIRIAREQKSISLQKRAEATYAEYRSQKTSTSGGRWIPTTSLVTSSDFFHSMASIDYCRYWSAGSPTEHGSSTTHIYFSEGASTTAASAVSSRKVKVSCRYSRTAASEWVR